MRRWIALALAASALAAPARANGFDYYLLALSWSPTWCATVGGPEAEQCAPDRDFGFIVHGLWPQFEEGWPEHCPSDEPDPSRRETAAMADVMGSGGLAWRQWTKHGRCSGLPAADYFALIRRAFRDLSPPELAPRMTPEAVEAALIVANPDLGLDTLVVTCGDGMLREVRLCLTPDLAPRTCGADVLWDSCRARAPLALPSAP